MTIKCSNCGADFEQGTRRKNGGVAVRAKIFHADGNVKFTEHLCGHLCALRTFERMLCCATDEKLGLVSVASVPSVVKNQALNNEQRLARQGEIFNHSGTCGKIVTGARA